MEAATTMWILLRGVDICGVLILHFMSCLADFLPAASTFARFVVLFEMTLCASCSCLRADSHIARFQIIDMHRQLVSRHRVIVID